MLLSFSPLLSLMALDSLEGNLFHSQKLFAGRQQYIHTTTAVLSGVISYNNFTCAILRGGRTMFGRFSLDFWHSFFSCWLALTSSRILLCSGADENSSPRIVYARTSVSTEQKHVRPMEKFPERGRQFCYEFCHFLPAAENLNYHAQTHETKCRTTPEIALSWEEINRRTKEEQAEKVHSW